MNDNSKQDNNCATFKSTLKNRAAELNFHILNNDDKTNVILEALSETDAKNFPKLQHIPDIIVSSLESVDDEVTLRDLCLSLIGEDRKSKTLLHYAALDKKQPELVAKLLECGFKNEQYAKFRNSVFDEVAKAFNCADEHENTKEIIWNLLKHKQVISQEYVTKAIESNNIDFLDLYFQIDKNLGTKIKNIPKKQQTSDFHKAIETSNIKTVKYLLSKLDKDVLDVSTKDDRSPVHIAKERAAKSNANIQSELIYQYLSRKMQVRKNQQNYQKELFELDAVILNKIHSILVELNDMYNSGKFLDVSPIGSRRYVIDQQPDDLLKSSDQSDICDEHYEYKVLVCLKKIVKCIELLGNHEGGIKDKFSMIPWDLLKSLPEALVATHKINALNIMDGRKLLEQISPDLWRLQTRIKELIGACHDCQNKASFDKFVRLMKGREVLWLNNVHKITDTFIDSKIVLSAVGDISLIESLDVHLVRDRCVFIQCLQKMGEGYKHLSPDKLKLLDRNGLRVIKDLRDELGHLWNRRDVTNKFLKVLEGTSLSCEECEAVSVLFLSWKDLIVNRYKPLLLSDENNQLVDGNERPCSLIQLLDKIDVSKVISGNNLVDDKLNLIKWAIGNVQKIVDDVTQEEPNYSSMRDRLRSPKMHYTCILMLTVIGESVHAIKDKDDFLSVVSFELMKELDFLKWVRNSLMHLDDVNEAGTLVDYLSNDLLTEYSIVTHGQKIVEFHKYFRYVSSLVDAFQQELGSLGNDNYFQKYNGHDKQYLNYDISRRMAYTTKVLAESELAWQRAARRAIDFDIENLIRHKEKIMGKCVDWKINVEGVFGRLANFGYATFGDLSGLLIDVGGGDLLDVTAKFKEYLDKLLGYRLKIVEKKQLDEYLKLKISDRKRREKYRRKLLQNVRKCSIENLANNIKLLNLLNRFDLDELGDIYRIVDADKICFEFHYLQNQNYFDLTKPVLHVLYDILSYEVEGNDDREKVVKLMKRVLKKHADINVPDGFGQTLLHKLCTCYDEKLLQVIKQYADNLDANRLSNDKVLPLEVALEHRNDVLVEFLKNKTDMERYGKRSLIAATKSGNVDFVRYLIDVHNVNVDVESEDGIPIVHYAIFQRSYDYLETLKRNKVNPENDEKYRRVIKLLLENGAQVYALNSDQLYIPLLWSLNNEDLELSSLLAENSIGVNYEDKDGVYPIHRAIVNCEKFPEERPKYLALIEKIAAKANGSLNLEWKGGQETPLYLAAKLRDLAIMKILLDNGADINYKSHRFDQISAMPDSEDVVKFFANNGMRGVINNLSALYEKYRLNTNELQGEMEKQSLHLNVLDCDGKNLFWYAVQNRNVPFVEWLSDKVTLNLDTRYVAERKRDTEIQLSYYNHIARRGNGAILKILQGRNAIDWNKFGGREVKLICDKAFKAGDLAAIKLMERFKYLYVSSSAVLEGNEATSYLRCYFDVFERIKNGGGGNQLERDLKNLKNKSALFEGQSLLHVAVSENNVDAIKFLLSGEVGLDPNVLNYCECSALDEAVEHNSALEVIQFLVDKRVKITENFPVLTFLSLDREKKDVVLKYLKDNAGFVRIFVDGAYSEPSRFNNADFIKFLLDLGWDPNEYSKSTSLFDGGRTALHTCAYNKYNDSIEVLCESGRVDFELPVMNFIIWSTSGYLTAVGFALENNNFTGARILIEHDASPYRYLLVLLLDALRNEDVGYANILLEKSIIIDLEETKTYLDHWVHHGFEITQDVISNAVRCLVERSSEIRCMPDYIYNQILNLQK